MSDSNDSTDPKDTLSEIREIMLKSSRLTILSGLSGVSAGVIALLGGIFIWTKYIQESEPPVNSVAAKGELSQTVFQVTEIAIIVFIFAAIAAFFFSLQKAKKMEIDYQSALAKRVLLHHLIFLLTGGVFAFILGYYGIFFLVPSALLMFYGLALLNFSKFTNDHIRNLGIAEIVLGIIAALLPSFSLWIWIFGFGVLHIAHGAMMYYKYDRPS
ncbi:hypothetical protein BH10BAC5_BH10BAC5_12890 [soil metagenome]